MYIIKCITFNDYLESIIKEEDGHFSISFTHDKFIANEYVSKEMANQVMSFLQSDMPELEFKLEVIE